MFEDSLIESGGKLKTKRGIWTFFSFILEAVLVGVLVLIPLLFTEALPKTQLMTFLVAPPPPPPPAAAPTLAEAGKSSRLATIRCFELKEQSRRAPFKGAVPRTQSGVSTQV